MGTSLIDNFDYRGRRFLDDRQQAATLAALRAIPESTVPDGFRAYCTETGRWYEYGTANKTLPDTGKWRLAVTRIAQETGDGEDAAISQKAVTEELCKTTSTVIRLTGTNETAGYHRIAESSVFIQAGSKITGIYRFTGPVGHIGWCLYGDNTDHQMLRDMSLKPDGTISRTCDRDLSRIIFYADTEEGVTAELNIEVIPPATVRELDVLSKTMTEDIQDMKALTDFAGRQKSLDTDVEDISVKPQVLKKVYTYLTIYDGGSLEIEVTDMSRPEIMNRVITYVGGAPSSPESIYMNGGHICGIRDLTGIPKGTKIDFYIQALGSEDETPAECRLHFTELTRVDPSSLSGRIKTLEDFADGQKNEKTDRSPYDGLHGVVMGDSHAVNRSKWAPYVFEKLGMVYDDALNAKVIGPANDCGAGYEAYGDSLLCQAIRAVERHKAGDRIDVVVMENVHYAIYDADIESAFPLVVDNIIDLGERESSVGNTDGWFDSNITALLGGKEARTGTMAVMRLRNARHAIVFSGTPKAGTLTLNVDGQEFNATLSGQETLAEAVRQLGIWAFDDYTDWHNTVSGNTIAMEYRGTSATPPAPAVSLDAGTTGLSIEVDSKEETSYCRRFFQSYDLGDWLRADRWVKVGNWAGYSGLKGVYETLLGGIPGVTVICVVFPCYAITEGQFKSMQEFHESSFYHSNRNRAVAFRTAGEYYNCKVVDVEGLCGISLPNWFQYNPPGNVHPNAEGYRRWAETIVRELR